MSMNRRTMIQGMTSVAPVLAAYRPTSPGDPASPRRLRIYYLPERWIVSLLRNIDTPRMAISTQPALPEGARIRSVYHDFSRQSWAILAEHSDFDEVPDGCVIPSNDDLIGWTNTILELEPDGRYRVVTQKESVP